MRLSLTSISSRKAVVNPHSPRGKVASWSQLLLVPGLPLQVRKR
jgi:hypothetical protein